MPDRELTEEETRKFVREHTTGELFHALDVVFLEEKTKPSLYDLCILELHAAVKGLRQILIGQGREINVLKERLKVLEGEKRR